MSMDTGGVKNLRQLTWTIIQGSVPKEEDPLNPSIDYEQHFVFHQNHAGSGEPVHVTLSVRMKPQKGNSGNQRAREAGNLT